MRAGGWGGWPADDILPNDGGSLRELNETIRFDLKYPLSLLTDAGNDIDENIFINDISNHIYCDYSQLYNMKHSNDYYFLSLNVCSLMSKFNELTVMIQNLQNEKCNLAVIAIQETWDIPYPELLQIPGFNLVFKTRSILKGGGVAFYINKNIKFKLINRLSPFIERQFECLTVEVIINKKKYIVSNVYKSPNPTNGTQNEHNELFIEHLDKHLVELSNCNADVLLFTDSNFNLLNINNNNLTAKYFETIYINGFNQKVGKATRIKNEIFSLIDHI